MEPWQKSELLFLVLILGSSYSINTADIEDNYITTLNQGSKTFFFTFKFSVLTTLPSIAPPLPAIPACLSFALEKDTYFCFQSGHVCCFCTASSKHNLPGTVESWGWGFYFNSKKGLCFSKELTILFKFFFVIRNCGLYFFLLKDWVGLFLLGFWYVTGTLKPLFTWQKLISRLYSDKNLCFYINHLSKQWLFVYNMSYQNE